VWCGMHVIGSYREASGAELDWIIIRLGFGLPCSAVLGFACLGCFLLLVMLSLRQKCVVADCKRRCYNDVLTMKGGSDCPSLP
jgi:hypothetical protein